MRRPLFCLLLSLLLFRSAAVAEVPAINMPAGPDYLTVDFGVTTWRGDSFRTNAAVGTLDAAPTGLELVWRVDTGLRPDNYSLPDAGFSWHSQPAIIQWPKELRAAMNLTEEAAATKALREVIFASLDGHIYFLNLADGTAAREALSPGFTMLGAVTVHPLGYPLLMAGQYATTRTDPVGPVGLRWYDLQDQECIHFVSGRPITGLDGAFNTSALIDANTNTAIALTRDGFLYTEALDLRCLVTDSRQFSMLSDFAGPRLVRLTGERERVTTAPVMYGSRLWFGTSEGRILCVDANALQLLWSAKVSNMVYTLGMAQDASGQLWLYTGDAMGSATDVISPVQLYRINADTGEISWATAAADSTAGFFTGAIAACIVGENELDEMVFFTLNSVCVSDGSVTSRMVAADRATGRIIWQRGLSGECKSSPIAVYTADGRGWIVQMAENGRMTLLDGLTGTEVAALTLAGDRWSSPAAFDDMLVIGSCVYGDDGLPAGGHIYGVRIR